MKMIYSNIKLVILIILIIHSKESLAQVTNPVHVAFLVQTEGFTTEAYCLSPTYYPNSGVTIGVGVDLGSKTAASLNSAGVSSVTVGKLTRYFGLKGKAACNAVSTFKVVLSQAEALDLSSKMISTYATQIASLYNAAKTKTAKVFTSLTCAQRTVIVDVLYQYGSPQKVPRFWTLVTTNNWSGTVSELRNFGDGFSNRRNKEADFLEYGGSLIDCPSASLDICLATRGSCSSSCVSPKKRLVNFCQTKASSISCCV